MTLSTIRGCRSEILPYPTPTSSRLTLDRGSQTYHMIDDSEMTSNMTNSERFSVLAKSVPDFREVWKPWNLYTPRCRSTMELAKYTPSSDASTSVISTDSLENAISPINFKGSAFEDAPRSELFVPEFIPLPVINSPMAFIRKGGQNKQPPCEYNDSLQSRQSISDYEVDVLTNVTSLQSESSDEESRPLRCVWQIITKFRYAVSTTIMFLYFSHTQPTDASWTLYGKKKMFSPAIFLTF